MQRYRKPARRKRVIVNPRTIAAGLLVVICAALVIHIIAVNQHKAVSETSLSGSSVSAADGNSENGGTAQKDWHLTLVNKWHPIDADYTIETTELSNGQLVDSRIYPSLQEMFDDMRSEGVYPIVASGYRTAQKQQEVYDSKVAEYIANGYSEADAITETDKWVAAPGTSEHQLGLGVDINADGVHSYGYQVYEWLAENAYRYGFIYRYQEDKVDVTGVANEPWHYRYVGAEVAADIQQRGICLEEYLDENNVS